MNFSNLPTPVDANPPMIELRDKDRKSVGKLMVKDDGSLTFEGGADESAQIFFDTCVAINNAEMKRLRKENKRLMGELDALCHKFS